jgi:hypothetical protein
MIGIREKRRQNFKKYIFGYFTFWTCGICISAASVMKHFFWMELDLE